MSITPDQVAVIIEALKREQKLTDEQRKLSYFAALTGRCRRQEQTRERVPLDWAMTQNNLGNALKRRRLAGTEGHYARPIIRVIVLDLAARPE